MIDRESLRALIDAWERRDLTPGEVVEHAEAIEREVEEWPDLDANRDAAREVLVHLADAHALRIHHDDIPALRRLLDAAPGEDVQALAEFAAYMNDIDWSSRERLLCDGYYWPDWKFLDDTAPPRTDDGRGHAASSRHSEASCGPSTAGTEPTRSPARASPRSDDEDG